MRVGNGTKMAMVVITVLLIVLIVVASIPAIVGIYLAIRMYRANRRRHFPFYRVYRGAKVHPTVRKKRRKPYQLEIDSLVSLEELASEITLDTIGESWRADNEWDNIVKISEKEQEKNWGSRN